MAFTGGRQGSIPLRTLNAFRAPPPDRLIQRSKVDGIQFSSHTDHRQSLTGGGF